MARPPRKVLGLIRIFCREVMVEARSELRANVGCLMLFQLLSRLLTFLGNTMILRMASPLVLGMPSVKLDLYIGTVLSLARDGVRMALVRMDRPARKEDERAWLGRFTSLSALSIPIGILVSIFLSMVLLKWPPAEIQQSEMLMAHYKSSIIYYSVSSLLELAVESIAALLIYEQRAKSRLIVELLSLGVRMTTVLYVVGNRMYSDEMVLGMRAFSYGQLVRSLTFMFGMLVAFRLEFPQYSLRRLVPSGFTTEGCGLALEMTKQLVLKYALAQGDMWIISMTSTISHQGVYSVVVNYGSLICRLVLQPLEESGLHYFSRALVPSAPTNDKKNAFKHLGMILKVDLLLSLAFAFIAPWYTKPLVQLLLGGRWASTNMPAVLAAYCLQIPAMAYCGILEAFMNSTLTPDWYQTVRGASVCFSALYIGTAILLVKRYETIGLVAAGALSFAMRAALGLYYLRGYLGKQKTQYSLDPWLSSATVFCIAGASILSAWSFVLELSAKEMLAIGSISASTISFSLLRWEKPFLLDLRQSIRGRKAKSS